MNLICFSTQVTTGLHNFKKLPNFLNERLETTIVFRVTSSDIQNYLMKHKSHPWSDVKWNFMTNLKRISRCSYVGQDWWFQLACVLKFIHDGKIQQTVCWFHWHYFWLSFQSCTEWSFKVQFWMYACSSNIWWGVNYK